MTLLLSLIIARVHPGVIGMMRGGGSFHDVPQLDFLGEFDVFELSELSTIFDHGIIGGETHEIMDQAQDDQAHARRRSVNVNRTVLRLIAILLKVQTADARVVRGLEWGGGRVELSSEGRYVNCGRVI